MELVFLALTETVPEGTLYKVLPSGRFNGVYLLPLISLYTALLAKAKLPG